MHFYVNFSETVFFRRISVLSGKRRCGLARAETCLSGPPARNVPEPEEQISVPMRGYPREPVKQGEQSTYRPPVA